MKIAVIGAGNLGYSIANGILDNKLMSSLYITKRNTASLKEFEGIKNVKITSNNAEAIVASEFVIIAVQPSQLNIILLYRQ